MPRVMFGVDLVGASPGRRSIARSASVTSRVPAGWTPGNGGDQPGSAARLPRLAATSAIVSRGRQRTRLAHPPRPTTSPWLVDEQPGDGLAGHPRPAAAARRSPCWWRRGMRARGAASPAMRVPTGLSASAASRCGRDAKQLRTSRRRGSTRDRRQDSRSSPLPRAGTCSRISPASWQPPVEGGRAGRGRPPRRWRRRSGRTLNSAVRAASAGRRNLFPTLRGSVTLGNEACQVRGHRNSSPGDAHIFEVVNHKFTIEQ